MWSVQSLPYVKVTLQLETIPSNLVWKHFIFQKISFRVWFLFPFEGSLGFLLHLSEKCILFIYANNIVIIGDDL